MKLCDLLFEAPEVIKYMCEQVLTSERIGSVLLIKLNRPARLNAFTASMHLALREALTVARDDSSVRAVLLTGEGRGFCAGQDLGARDPRAGGPPPDLGETLDKFYNPLIRQMRALPLPIVCAVNGVAAGAGANIALACDVVLAAKSAKFIQSFAKLGLVPDAGGTWTLTHLIGEARAKALALTGEPLSAEQAVDWGLIWRAVDDEQLIPEALAVAERMTKASSTGLAMTKHAIQMASTQGMDEQLDLERDLQRQAGVSPDYAEGVLSFLEKRQPEFAPRGKSE